MDEHLLLGAPDIDRQHFDLFRLLGHLEAAVSDERAIADALSQLTTLLHAHFKSEEKLMATLAMPEGEIEEHTMAHYRIIEDLSEIHLSTMSGLRIPHSVMVARVSTYVLEHIIKFDLQLKPYIAELAKKAFTHS